MQIKQLVRSGSKPRQGPKTGSEDRVRRQGAIIGQVVTEDRVRCLTLSFSFIYFLFSFCTKEVLVGRVLREVGSEGRVRW